MFTNPGKKIEQYAKVIFWIKEVLVILIGFSLLFNSCYYGYTNNVQFLTGCIVLVGGTFWAWVSVIFLIALGHFFDDISKIKEAIVDGKEELVAELHTISTPKTVVDAEVTNEKETNVE